MLFYSCFHYIILYMHLFQAFVRMYSTSKKKYAYSLRFVLFFCGLALFPFTHILQVCSTGLCNYTTAILPRKHPRRIWVNKSHETKKIYNHNKTKHNNCVHILHRWLSARLHWLHSLLTHLSYCCLALNHRHDVLHIIVMLWLFYMCPSIYMQ